MATPKQTFTYRQGKKVKLDIQPDEVVVRLRPEQASARLGLDRADMEQMSSQSTRVRVQPANMEATLREMRKVAPTHRSYRRADTNAEFLITDRLFVTFAQPPDDAQLGDFLADYSLVLLDRYSDTDVLVQLTEHTGMSPVDLVVRLTEQEPRVAVAEHDLNQRAEKAVATPTDPQYRRQWFLHDHFQHAQFDPRSSSRCEAAWNRLGSYGSADVVVGVTDDGCRLDHPDFSDAKFAGWAYFEGRRLLRSTDVDADPARMYDPGEDHGSSCAGVIAGEVDGVHTVGAAPAARLVPIKWQIVDDYLSITDSKMMTLLAYAADRVDVLSSSWSSAPNSEWASVVVTRIAELARTGGRRGRGILFLFAAGNENCPLSHSGNRDVPYSDGWEYRPDDSRVWVGPDMSRRFVNNLVDVPGVAHVAALASNAQRSHYSNYGKGITLCAPTNNAHAFERDVVPGLSVTTTTGDVSLVTHDFGGTSSSTPLVAGVAALVISANPNLTALEVLGVLKRTASQDLNATGYRRTPPTSYDANTGWDVSPIAPFDDPAFVDVGDPDGRWSPWFGHGRVDALAAVVEAFRLAGAVTPAPEPPLELESQPGLRIPDADENGVEDVIHVAARGPIGWLEVQVDVRHSYIGDLLVRLVAPDGTRATLHSRAGASADDLQRTWDPSNRAGLEGLLGKDMAGDWKLQVVDREGGDTGRLVSWRLKLTRAGLQPPTLDRAGVAIPDGDATGVVRTLRLPGGQPIRGVRVDVEITHPWIPDLRLQLLPPGAPPMPLPVSQPTAAGKLVRSWTDRDLAALAALRGRDPAGEWKLRVADVAEMDEGTLDSWSLEVVT